MNKDKLLGGLYGLALGDAVGVPFEFKERHEIPKHEKIEMIMPSSFPKTYENVPYGTWSDDTSLTLCLLDGLLQTTNWDDVFVANMLEWRYNGKYAVDGKKFDIGMQTAHALSELGGGTKIEDRSDPNAYGNGALMRTLPVALTTPTGKNATSQIHYLNKKHVCATHANNVSVITSDIYAMWAHNLLLGQEMQEAFDGSVSWITELMVGHPGINSDMDLILSHATATGSGFVVDTLWSAYSAICRGHDFKSTIRRSIQFGQDTDTTACVAGGIAGIMYGYDALPKDWLENLRGKHVIDEFAARLLEYHGLS